MNSGNRILLAVGNRRRIGLIPGPVLSVVLLIFYDLDPGNPSVTRSANKKSVKINYQKGTCFVLNINTLFR